MLHLHHPHENRKKEKVLCLECEQQEITWVTNSVRIRLEREGIWLVRVANLKETPQESKGLPDKSLHTEKGSSKWSLSNVRILDFYFLTYT